MDDARAALAHLAAAARREARLPGGPGVRQRARLQRRRRYALHAVLASTLMLATVAVAAERLPVLRPTTEPGPPAPQLAPAPTPYPTLRPTADETPASPRPTPAEQPTPAPRPTPASTGAVDPGSQQVPSTPDSEASSSPPASAQPSPAPSQEPSPSPAPAPAPPPAALVELALTSICSPDPTTVRVWRVRNANAGALSYRWDVYGSAQGQAGGGSAPPGDSFFETAAESGANTVRLLVDGVVHDVKAGNPQACP